MICSTLSVKGCVAYEKAGEPLIRRGQIGDVSRFCGHCDTFPVYSQDRCRGCYLYRNEMGTERPYERIQAAINKRLGKERKWEAMSLGSIEA